MGVSGLATFLAENRQSLCTTRQFSGGSALTDGTTHIVVDAWGIIFQLYLDLLPWASGGEYLRLYRITRRLIESWRRIGLEPTFVFDGPAPPEKHDTILDRLQQRLFTSRVFYSTSSQSRSFFSFARSSAILPPFALATFVHALHSLNVNTHFVPSGEADGVMVTIANELGAYIFGKDSDYLILISGSGAKNVKGYCPLDMLEWIEGAPQNRQLPPSEASWRRTDLHQDDWSIAQNKKRQSQRQSSYLPPLGSVSPVLVATTVEPAALRQRFLLPASHIPLLAALAGNDYVPYRITKEMFDSKMSKTKRIELVARLIRETHYAPSAVAARAQNAGDQAVDMVKKLVTKLCAENSPYTSQSMINEMVESIIGATLQYVLPSTLKCCELSPFCGNINGRGCGGHPDMAYAERAGKAAYASAMRKGYTPSLNQAYAYPDRVYTWTVLEDPSGPSLFASTYQREVRRQAWSIEDVGIGGFLWPTPDDIGEEEDEGMEEMEEMEKMEEDHDSQTMEDDSTRAGDETSQSDVKTCVELTSASDGRTGEAASDPKRVILEYIRQGSSHQLQAVSVPLNERQLGTDATMQCLLPTQDRLRIYRLHLHSDTSEINRLPVCLHSLIAAIRLSIICVSARAGSNYSIKFRESEVEALLKAGLGVYAGWLKDAKTCRPKRDSDDGQYPILQNRAVNIVAQFKVSLLSAYGLAQALLLTPDIDPQEYRDSPSLPIFACDNPLPHLTPFMFFSGTAIHTLLAGNDPPPSTGWIWSTEVEHAYERCLLAVMVDMKDHITGTRKTPLSEDMMTESQLQEKADNTAVRDEEGHSIKKKKKKKPKVKTGSPMGSRFDLLEAVAA